MQETGTAPTARFSVGAYAAALGALSFLFWLVRVFLPIAIPRSQIWMALGLFGGALGLGAVALTRRRTRLLGAAAIACALASVAVFLAIVLVSVRAGCDASCAEQESLFRLLTG
jgi:hypothetical protein